MSRIKDVLLYDINAVYERLFGILKEETLVAFPAFILIGAMLAFFFGMDFGGVAKRAFIGMFAIFSFSWFFIGSGDIGFKVGDRLLSTNNHILKSWASATTTRQSGFQNPSKKNGQANKKGWIESLSKDVLGFFIWIISNFALWFVKITFTMAYYMPLILLPVAVAVSLLPLTPKAIEGAMVTSIWVGVTPIVISVMIEILNAILVSDNIMENASWISKALMSILFAFYLASSFTLAYKMIGQTGISEGISQIGQNFSTGLVSGGLYTLRSKATGFGKRMIFSQNGKSSPLKKLTVDPIKSQKNKIYQKSEKIRNEHPETASQVSAKGDKKWTKGESNIHKMSAISNPIKSFRDKRDRVYTAKQAINSGNNSKIIDRKSTNIMREERGKKKISSKGNTYRSDHSSRNNKAKLASYDSSLERIMPKRKIDHTPQEISITKTVKPKEKKWDTKHSTTNTKNKRI